MTRFSHLAKVRRLLCLPLVALAITACNTTQKPPDVIVLMDNSGNVSNSRVNFKTDIAPLLQQRCVICHHDQGHRTGLSFQRRSSIIEASDERPILVPGDQENRILFMVTVMPEYFVEAMPPNGHRTTASPPIPASANSQPSELKNQFPSSNSVWSKLLFSGIYN